MRLILIEESDGSQRLDKFLRRYLPGAADGFLYRMIRKKNITVNGSRAAGNTVLSAGDEVRLFFSDETIERFQNARQNSADDTVTPIERSRIIYADADVMLVNKPAGMLTQKAEDRDISLADRVTAYMDACDPGSRKNRYRYDPGPANRLDRNTSGMVIFPLNLKSAQNISLMLRERSVKKEYLALVEGRCEISGLIRGRYSRDAASNTAAVTSAAEGHRGGSIIETEIEPLEATDRYTLLLVRLITGKTHQIRAQMAAVGNPVAGDPKYGIIDRKTGLKRQFLHAWKLTFPDTDTSPAGLRGRTFTAPLPDDLSAALRNCGIKCLS